MKNELFKKVFHLIFILSTLCSNFFYILVPGAGGEEQKLVGGRGGGFVCVVDTNKGKMNRILCIMLNIMGM